MIVSIVGIGPFANLGSDDRNGGGSACEKAPFVIVYYAKGAMVLTKCGLEAVNREVASAILVVKVQCADPLCNATLGVQWWKYSSNMDSRIHVPNPVTRAGMVHARAYPALPPTTYIIPAARTGAREGDCKSATRENFDKAGNGRN